MTFDSIRKVRYCWISLDILALCDPFFEPQRSQTNVIDCQLTSCKTRLLKLGICRKPLKTIGSKISLGGLLTGHKGLQYLQSQRNLSPRQTRWLETLSDFDFTVEYIPGETNIVADSLSRIYSADSTGTVRVASKFVSDDILGDLPTDVRSVLSSVSRPILTDAAIALASAALPSTISTQDQSAVAPLPTCTVPQTRAGSLPCDS